MIIALSVLSTILSIMWCLAISPVLAMGAMAAVSAMGGPNVPLPVRTVLSAGVICVGLLTYIGVPILIFKLIL